MPRPPRMAIPRKNYCQDVSPDNKYRCLLEPGHDGVHRGSIIHEWPDQTNDCSRCDGTGEIVVTSYDVGDDCYNDDFDTCPRCKGTGEEPKDG